MGRPPLNVKATLVRLPDNLAERIDALAGPNKRADYIRKAVVKQVESDERSLKRRGKEKGE
jgi:predicted DNA-binding protein